MNITIFCYPFILWMQYYWDESLFYNGYEWILQYFVIHLYYGCSITEMNHYFIMDMNEYYYILLSIYIMDAVLLRWITILWWIWMNITIFCYPFILWMQYYWDGSLFHNGYEWILLYFVIHLYYGCSITEMNHYLWWIWMNITNILLSIYIIDAVLLRWITIL
jgi:hypothetical protein